MPIHEQSPAWRNTETVGAFKLPNSFSNVNFDLFLSLNLVFILIRTVSSSSVIKFPSPRALHFRAPIVILGPPLNLRNGRVGRKVTNDHSIKENQDLSSVV